MTRKDRLHALAQTLSDGAVHSAEALARRHGVSLRTIYRDMATLAAAGTGLRGTPGQGYRMAQGVTLPPLALSEAELEALLLGLAALGETALDQAPAAQALSARIEALLPEDGSAPQTPGVGAHPFADNPAGAVKEPALRAAIGSRQKLRVVLGGQTHSIRPLHLAYQARAWRCVAWSETTARFLHFALDQIEAMTPLPGLFVDEPGKTYADWQAQTPL